MSCITEIQGDVMVVIIWWCDLQLHMSYITEIQGAVVVVIIWWYDLQLHMSYIVQHTQKNKDGIHEDLLTLFKWVIERLKSIREL
jgi:hypothetical protein